VAKLKQTENAILIVAPKRDTSSSPTPIILAGVAILATFFGVIALWGTFVPLNAAVHAQGEVVFQNKRQSVQHQEGGIIKEILVKDGTTVIAGQPLIILENDQVKPIVDMYQSQAAAETATMIRLEAEKDDRPSVTFPQSIPASAVNTETKIFNAKRDAYIKQIDVLKSQILQSKEILKGAEEQLASKKKEIAFIKEQLDANQQLRKARYVTKTVVLDQERMLAEKNGDREQITSSIATNVQRQAELEQRILALRADRIQLAANEIKQSGMKRAELEERVRPSIATMAHQIIRAPVAGKVVGLKVSTIGGVVIPREPLMDIAPQTDHLIIEGKIGVNDISDVKLGQKAEVTLTAFKSSEVPSVTAQVTYISDDRLTMRTAQGDSPYYSAYLELDPASVKALAGLELVPGMQAQVAIATKPRTALDYFFGPLRDRMGKAFHAK
jgi:HlyD family type I secretion membrane fusion protein